jgi:hypothetical protein
MPPPPLSRPMGGGFMMGRNIASRSFTSKIEMFAVFLILLAAGIGAYLYNMVKDISPSEIWDYHEKLPSSENNWWYNDYSYKFYFENPKESDPYYNEMYRLHWGLQIIGGLIAIASVLIAFSIALNITIGRAGPGASMARATPELVFWTLLMAVACYFILVGLAYVVGANRIIMLDDLYAESIRKVLRRQALKAAENHRWYHAFTTPVSKWWNSEWIWYRRGWL